MSILTFLKRALSTLLVFSILVVMLPLSAQAADMAYDLSKERNDITILLSDSTNSIRFTGSLVENKQVILQLSSKDAIVYLDSISIINNGSYSFRIVGPGNVEIILTGNNSIKGLDIYNGANVTISGQGSLEASITMQNSTMPGITLSDASTLLITGRASVKATGGGTGWDIGKAAAGTGGSTMTIGGGAVLELGNTGIDTGSGNLKSIFIDCEIKGTGAEAQGIAGNYSISRFSPQIAIQNNESAEIPWNGTRMLVVANASDYINPAYKWYKNNSEITGQTGANLTVSEAGTYKVAITDIGSMSSEASITLTKQAEPDTTPPIVQSMTPANNATGVATSGDISITFDEAIATTGTVSLDGGIGALTDSSNWSNGNKTYTIPYSNLAYSTKYTVTIEGFKDAAGNTMTADSSHTFTTTTAPTYPGGSTSSESSGETSQTGGTSPTAPAQTSAPTQPPAPAPSATPKPATTTEKVKDILNNLENKTLNDVLNAISELEPDTIFELFKQLPPGQMDKLTSSPGTYVMPVTSLSGCWRLPQGIVKRLLDAGVVIILELPDGTTASLSGEITGAHLALTPIGTGLETLPEGYGNRLFASAKAPGNGTKQAKAQTTIPVREAPLNRAKLVRSLKPEAQLFILGATEGREVLVFLGGNPGELWYKVSVGSKEGYVRADFVEALKDQYPIGASIAIPAESKQPKAAVRPEPKRSSKALVWLENGATVTITGKSGGWYEVTTADGQTGYVEEGHCAIDW